MSLIFLPRHMARADTAELPSGSLGSSGLALVLDTEDGTLKLSDRDFFDWLRVDRLVLQVPGIPADLPEQTPPERFQSRRNRVGEAAFSLSQEGLDRLFELRQEVLESHGIVAASARCADGGIELSCRVREGRHVADVSFWLYAAVLPPAGMRESGEPTGDDAASAQVVHLVLDRALVHGFLPTPAPVVAHRLLVVLAAAVTSAGTTAERGRPASPKSSLNRSPNDAPNGSLEGSPEESEHQASEGADADGHGNEQKDPEISAAGAPPSRLRILGLGHFCMAPLAGFLWEVLPAAGWRLPAMGEASIYSLCITRDRVGLAYGQKNTAMDLPASNQRIAALLARMEHVDAGDRALLAGERERALHIYRKHLPDPSLGAMATARVLALCAADPAHFSEGLELARTQLERDPDNSALAAAAFAAMTAAAVERGLWADVATYLECIADLAPGDGERVSALLGAARLQAGTSGATGQESDKTSDEDSSDGQAAQALYERVLALEPGNAEATAALEARYRAQGQWRELLALLRARIAIAEEPRSQVADRLAICAILLHHLGDANAAHEELLQVRRIDPVSLPALEFAVELCLARRESRAAIEALGHIANLRLRNGDDDKAAAAYVRAGVLWEVEGDDEEADACYQEALSLSENDLGALERAAALAQRSGDGVRADALWERFESLGGVRGADRRLDQQADGQIDGQIDGQSDGVIIELDDDSGRATIPEAQDSLTLGRRLLHSGDEDGAARALELAAKSGDDSIAADAHGLLAEMHRSHANNSGAAEQLDAAITSLARAADRYFADTDAGVAAPSAGRKGATGASDVRNRAKGGGPNAGPNGAPNAGPGGEKDGEAPSTAFAEAATNAASIMDPADGGDPGTVYLTRASSMAYERARLLDAIGRAEDARSDYQRAHALARKVDAVGARATARRLLASEGEPGDADHQLRWLDAMLKSGIEREKRIDLLLTRAELASKKAATGQLVPDRRSMVARETARGEVGRGGVDAAGTTGRTLLAPSAQSESAASGGGVDVARVVESGLADIEAALRSGPDNLQRALALMLRSQLLYAVGDSEGHARALEERAYLTAPSERAAAEVEAAEAWLEAGNAESALRAARRALKYVSPDADEGRRNHFRNVLGNTAWHARDWDLVADTYGYLLIHASLPQAASDGEGHAAEEDAGDSAEAISQYARYIYRLGIAREARGEHAEAVAMFERLFSLPAAKGNALAAMRGDSMRALSRLYEQSGDPERAAKLLESLAGDIEVAPDSRMRADAWVRAGELWRRQDMLTDAERCFEAALYVVEDHLPALDALESLERGRGEYERLAVVLGRKLAATSGNVSHQRAILLRLATVQGHRLGRREVALASFRRVLELDPNCRPALAFIADWELAQGHFDAAANAYERLARILPGEEVPLRGAKLAADRTTPPDELLEQRFGAAVALDRLAKRDERFRARSHAIIESLAQVAPEHPTLLSLRLGEMAGERGSGVGLPADRANGNGDGTAVGMHSAIAVGSQTAGQKTKLARVTLKSRWVRRSDLEKQEGGAVKVAAGATEPEAAEGLHRARPMGTAAQVAAQAKSRSDKGLAPPPQVSSTKKALDALTSLSSPALPLIDESVPIIRVVEEESAGLAQKQEEPEPRTTIVRAHWVGGEPELEAPSDGVPAEPMPVAQTAKRVLSSRWIGPEDLPSRRNKDSGANRAATGPNAGAGAGAGDAAAEVEPVTTLAVPVAGAAAAQEAGALRERADSALDSGDFDAYEAELIALASLLESDQRSSRRSQRAAVLLELADLYYDRLRDRTRAREVVRAAAECYGPGARRDSTLRMLATEASSEGADGESLEAYHAILPDRRNASDWAHIASAYRRMGNNLKALTTLEAASAADLLTDESAVMLFGLRQAQKARAERAAILETSAPVAADVDEARAQLNEALNLYEQELGDREAAARIRQRLSDLNAGEWWPQPHEVASSAAGGTDSASGRAEVGEIRADSYGTEAETTDIIGDSQPNDDNDGDDDIDEGPTKEIAPQLVDALAEIEEPELDQASISALNTTPGSDPEASPDSVLDTLETDISNRHTAADAGPAVPVASSFVEGDTTPDSARYHRPPAGVAPAAGAAPAIGVGPAGSSGANEARSGSYPLIGEVSEDRDSGSAPEWRLETMLDSAGATRAPRSSSARPHSATRLGVTPAVTNKQGAHGTEAKIAKSSAARASATGTPIAREATSAAKPKSPAAGAIREGTSASGSPVASTPADAPADTPIDVPSGDPQEPLPEPSDDEAGEHTSDQAVTTLRLGVRPPRAPGRVPRVQRPAGKRRRTAANTQPGVTPTPSQLGKLQGRVGSRQTITYPGVEIDIRKLESTAVGTHDPARGAELLAQSLSLRTGRLARHGLPLDDDSRAVLGRLRDIARRAGKYRLLAHGLEAVASVGGAPSERVDYLRQAAAIWLDRLQDKRYAARLLLRALELAPADSSILQQSDGLLRELGDMRRLSDAYQLHIRNLHGPHRARPLYELGKIYRDHMQDTTRAVNCFSRAHEADPGRTEVWLPLANARFAADDVAGARRLYELILSQGAPDAETREWVLSRLETLGRSPSRPIRMLSNPLRRRTVTLAHAAGGVVKSGDALLEEALRRAAAFEAQGRRDAAVAQYRAAAERVPGDHRSLDALARLYQDSNDLETFVDVLGELIEDCEEGSPRAELWLYRARIYQGALGREAEAYRCLEEGYREDPTSREVASVLRQAAEVRGEWNRAAELIEREIETAETTRDIGMLHLELAVIFDEKLLAAEKARHHYEQALAHDPGLAAAPRPLARLYELAGRYAEAARMNEFASHYARDDSQRSRLLYRAGVAAERDGDRDGARRLYHLAALAAPKGDDASASHQALLRLDDRSEEARTELLELELRDADNDEQRIDILRQLLDRATTSGDIDAADRHARSLLSMDGADLSAYLVLKSQAEATSDWSALASLLNARAVSLSDPDERAAVYYDLGRLYQTKLDNSASAVRSFERALVAEPRHPAALEALADLVYQAGDWERARQLYARMKPEQSATAIEELAYRRGSVAEKLGHHREALEAYSEAVEHMPAYRRALEAMLALAKEVKDLPRAIHASRGLLELLPPEDIDRLTEARIRLAELYAENDNTDSAMEYCRLVLADEPNTEAALWLLADLSERRGDFEGAARSLRRLGATIASPSRRAELLYRLGELYRTRLRDLDQAADAYLRGVDLDPNHAPTLRRLVDHYWREGDVEQVMEMADSLSNQSALLDEETGVGTAGRVLMAIAGSGQSRRLWEIAEWLGDRLTDRLVSALAEALEGRGPRFSISVLKRAVELICEQVPELSPSLIADQLSGAGSGAERLVRALRTSPAA